MTLADQDGQSHMGLIGGYQRGLARLDGTGIQFEIDLRRLDGIDLPTPAIIKIDVEGHEAKVFRGPDEF